MYAAHYLLGVLAAALIGFGLGVMMHGIASHVLGRGETPARRRGFLPTLAVVVGAFGALLALWLFALTDLATWGQPVLGAAAVLGAALGWWTGPALRDAFITRPTYRQARGRRGSPRRPPSDGEPNPFASLEDDPAPPP